MVSDMIITHHESDMKDRLSGKSHDVSVQLPQQKNVEQCKNLDGEAQQHAERNGPHRNQTKNVSKEDPMSHRIIEKRRRDRMNNCLADLSRLIPAEYMKKGRGRVEKTEIIEMAIKHMKYLQSHVSSSVGDQPPPREPPEPTEAEKSENSTPEQPENSVLMPDQYRMGFLECLTETMQYLVEVHGYPPNHGLCLSLINHLQQHCAQIIKGKQVIHDVMKQEIILEVNKFNANMLTYIDGDGAYDETDQQKHSLRNSKSLTSTNTSYDQTLQVDRCSMSFTTDSYSSNGSMYKFKTDIKQRFSAENSAEDLADYYAPDKKRRRKESSDCTDDCGRQDVPIFALHANGSYYIPLTVNRDVMPPALDHALTETRSSVIVHPISISVNFQATNQF